MANATPPDVAPPFALPPGSVLRGQYRIRRVLGRPGGFGIVYLAHDQALDTPVAIKEFMPRALVGREEDRATVQPHSRSDHDLFEYGLQRFVGEARTLARLDHSNLPRVMSFFEANGTAYLVMDYYDGRTLLAQLERQGGRIPAPVAVDLMIRVLDGLRAAHEKSILHRDVKPENIYLTRSGHPLLLDFGAARQAVGTRSQSLTTILTPAYAPVEQYSSQGNLQGPWTDVYACAAVLYRCITGKDPPPASARLERDDLVPPRRLVPELAPALNDAILAGLAMDRRKRPQSAGEFQDLLDGGPVPGSGALASVRRRRRPADGPDGVRVATFAVIGLALLALLLSFAF